MRKSWGGLVEFEAALLQVTRVCETGKWSDCKCGGR